MGFVGGLVVGALVLALAGGGYWWWQQRDDDDSDGGGGSATESVSDPQKVAEGYYAQLEAKDCDFIDLITDRYAVEARAGFCINDPDTYFSQATVEGGDFQVGEIDIDGSKAVAKVRFLVDGVLFANGTTTLVRRDGDWLVDGEEFTAA